MIPLLWINLERHEQRRRRMQWALDQGGWWHERIPAVDGADSREHLIPIVNPFHPGNDLPGILRRGEADPNREVLRAELACMASWLAALARGMELIRETGAEQLLVLEDDCGAALARPDAWAFSLEHLLEQLGEQTRAAGVPWFIVQMLPTSRRAQESALQRWRASQHQDLLFPRNAIRSGGTGAVLLHRRALPRLVNGFQRWLLRHHSHVHLLVHPRGVRPLADKWMYGSVPAAGVWVPSYPLFCLDASDSAIHPEHVEAFQVPSRAFTIATWEQDGRHALVSMQRRWDDLL